RVRAGLDGQAAGFGGAGHGVRDRLHALDGMRDGTPPRPRPWQHEWARDFQAAFDAFAERVDRNRRVAIDPYAAEAPEEFFAVCSEYHFSDPATLRREMPAVAAHLERFYGQAPDVRQGNLAAP